MKSVKCLLPLLFLVAVFFCGCTSREEKKIEEVIKQELDLLKNLDSDTTQKYLSYQELFEDGTKDKAQSATIEEVFSLFFQEFDYKILDINVDKDKNTAQADLRLVTLDAGSLARDFSAEQLKKEISQAATGQTEDTGLTVSVEERYKILDDLLKSKDYQTVERSCTITLTASSDNTEDNWEIKRTYSLENDLVGGQSQRIYCL